MEFIRHGLALIMAFLHPVSPEFGIRADVGPTAVIRDVPRIGLNLGEWTSWGAAQLMGNVLMNPGFEGTLDRALVIVTSPDSLGFLDSTPATGRMDGFWRGGDYAVLTGAAKGQTGRINESYQQGREGLPEIQPVAMPLGLKAHDVVSVMRTDDTGVPSGWWIPSDHSAMQIQTILGDKRPGSSGLRSLRLDASSGEAVHINSFLDAIGGRAGKLLPVTGQWHFSLWTKGDSNLARVRVVFRRGNHIFLEESIPLSTEWQPFHRLFTGQDVGPDETLQLEIIAESGQVTIDDLSLGPVDMHPSGFRSEVVETLKRMHPGYLRDWQGQLGDSWSNRLTDAMGRRMARYRPEHGSEQFLYSLPEFLDLSAAVGSRPWIIVPTVLTGAELQSVGVYLKDRLAKDGFEEIVIEFGNENWNEVFRPAGITDPIIHGQLATEAIRNIREGAGHDPRLVFAVNGQHANPQGALKVMDETPEADLLVVAPYWFTQANHSDSPEVLRAALYANDPVMDSMARAARGAGHHLGVYEINTHTTQGSLPSDKRDAWANGQESAIALAHRLTRNLMGGVGRQCVYNFAQFDTFTEDHQGLVKLWGVVSDLAGVGHLRPSGQILSIMNQVLPGDVYPVTLKGQGADQVHVLMVRNADSWRYLAISVADHPIHLTLHFPSALPSTNDVRRLVLKADTETLTPFPVGPETRVPMTSPMQLDIPPHGLVALLP